jgi:Tol biopolymer transport system component
MRSRVLLIACVFTLLASAQAPPSYASKVTIFDLKTRSARTVWSSDTVVEAPNWSRDGKHLLINTGGRLYRLAVDVEGAHPEPLTLDPQYRCNNDHDYSPDGRRIAFSASTPGARGSRVYIANADGSNVTRIVEKSPSYFHGWSPDGQSVAIVAQRDGHYNLFRVPAAGGEEQRLTSKPVYDDGPDYSPDGRWIYFNSDRSGSWDVWRMPATGAGAGDQFAQRVTADEMEDWFPHPSPNGKLLLIFSFPHGVTGHNARMPGVELRLMKMPGKKLKPARPETLLTFFGGQGTINVNSWSPDSRRFAFVVYEPRPAVAR